MAHFIFNDGPNASLLQCNLTIYFFLSHLSGLYILKTQNPKYVPFNFLIDVDNYYERQLLLSMISDVYSFRKAMFGGVLI
ncbi:hypothetical protein QQ008_03420 [Fulvivirgaceae bacterium BMA10]|uniref:Uncharacterized protein n=1 Tax=Splendidivirga corallicola TaxID=3051826 RepID=A0ABT8KK00_9BACT|nr:hypothetical protein [Fulvivirgaceae bacterium BMA10]